MTGGFLPSRWLGLLSSETRFHIWSMVIEVAMCNWLELSFQLRISARFEVCFTKYLYHRVHRSHTLRIRIQIVYQSISMDMGSSELQRFSPTKCCDIQGPFIVMLIPGRNLETFERKHGVKMRLKRGLQEQRFPNSSLSCNISLSYTGFARFFACANRRCWPLALCATLASKVRSLQKPYAYLRSYRPRLEPDHHDDIVQGPRSCHPCFWPKLLWFF